MAGKPVWGLRKMVDCSAFYFSLPLHIVLPGVDKRKIHFSIFLPPGVCFFLKKKNIYIYIYIFFFNI